MRKRKRRKRRCGLCNACCVVIRVEELDKPAGTPCQHLCEGNPKGCCSIYDDRPHGCEVFRCYWLKGNLADDMRPDLCGVMFEEGEIRDSGGKVLWEMVLAIPVWEGAEHEDKAQNAIKSLVRPGCVVMIEDHTLYAESKEEGEQFQRAFGRIRAAVDSEGNRTEFDA